MRKSKKVAVVDYIIFVYVEFVTGINILILGIMLWSFITSRNIEHARSVSVSKYSSMRDYNWSNKIIWSIV